MTIDQVKQGFAGVRRGFGIERHSLKSLSKRLMIPRSTVKRMLKAGQLQFQQQFSAGRHGRTYEFSSARLDAMREQIVNSIINDIRARLEELDLTDEETAVAAHTGLRAQKANVELEFSKPNDPDDDDEDGSDVSKLVGGAVGAGEGAGIGSGLGGGSLGSLVGGTVAGGAVGEQAGGGNKLAQVAAAGGLGYIAHKAILQNGGYAEVARKAGIAGSDLWNAVRGMLAKTAKAEV